MALTACQPRLPSMAPLSEPRRCCLGQLETRQCLCPEAADGSGVFVFAGTATILPSHTGQLPCSMLWCGLPLDEIMFGGFNHTYTLPSYLLRSSGLLFCLLF